ncbi:MAG: hypothetical protein AAF429_11390 [Pseudomonadota bacterium]
METNFSAVLTGDFVNSRQMSQSQIADAFEQLENTANEINENKAWIVFERYRGDGWQLFIDQANLSIDLAIAITCALKALPHPAKTRISIGFGSASFVSKSIFDASGTAFTNSGDALENMAKDQLLAIDHTLGDVARAAINLLDFQMQHWTKAQSQAVYYKVTRRLIGITDQEIADKLNITRQAVQARLSSVGFRHLTSAVHHLEGAIIESWKNA